MTICGFELLLSLFQLMMCKMLEGLTVTIVDHCLPQALKKGIFEWKMQDTPQ
jgi:hypothetical protein